MAWWTSSRAVYRAEVRSSALELAAHGWPLLPGTHWRSGRWVGAGTEPAAGPVPIDGIGLAAATADPAQVEAWWAVRPHSVLVATGAVVDVIEMSALVGRRVCATLRDRGLVVAVAATPTGRWWFPVRAGDALRPELASRQEVVLHGRGSWVAAPPSEGPQGVVQWRVTPETCDWLLPKSCDLQVAVLDVVGSRPAAAPLAPGAALGSVGTGVRS